MFTTTLRAIGVCVFCFRYKGPAVTGFLLLVFGFSGLTPGNEWSIPAGGNVFRSLPEPGGRGISREGWVGWQNPTDVYSLYFHVNRPARLDLSLEARVPEGESSLLSSVGQQTFETRLTGSEWAIHPIGQIELDEPGYIRVDWQGQSRDGQVFAQIRNLVVTSDTPDLELHFVRSNEGNMFYWGRRGPSVHLRYEVPRDRQLEYAYSELTVPEDQDPIGTFYMANGFGEGYFGIQVNSPTERRVLFSVWSPFRTDNPREIPEDQRIAALARGPEVRVGEFGNEGSGGQSYLIYPWEAGRTYCFLTQVVPDGKGNTIYTAWFADKEDQSWRLIASFRRPKTDTHLRGFHSFLESFNPDFGHVPRQGHHANVWVRDTQGQWHECTAARFSVDATGGGGHRLDFTGGAVEDHFFLRNCGFFSETRPVGEMFNRPSAADQQPRIDFQQLPRE